MPPTPGLDVGREAVLRSWVQDGFTELGAMRTVLTAVNRQPAVAAYLWQELENAYLPLTIDVLRVSGGKVSRQSCTVPIPPGLHWMIASGARKRRSSFAARPSSRAQG